MDKLERNVIIVMCFMLLASAFFEITRAEQLLGVDTTRVYMLQPFALDFLISGILLGIVISFAFFYWNRFNEARLFSAVKVKGGVT